jgi:cell division protein FtsI/penicillin-binding protein 2
MTSPPRALLLVSLAALVLSACSISEPEPSPVPTPAPRAEQADAILTVHDFLDAWADGAYARLYAHLAAVDRAHVPGAQVRGLLYSFDELAHVTHLTAEVGDPVPVALPPEPAPTPGPTTEPTSTPDASSAPTSAVASPTAEPTPSASPVPPGTPLDGPIVGLAVPVQLHFSTGNFGEIDLSRQLVLVPEGTQWAVRWTPRLLFPELGEDGHLELQREAPVRGSIVGLDGTVWAETRDDGIRVYPQEWLAGQTIGYVGRANRDDLVSLERDGVRLGDPIGRSGLELGADALLRGRPGFTLTAVPADGEQVTLYQRPVEQGAEIAVTLRRSLQSTAQSQIAGYNEAGTAVIDPTSGDVWALASAPVFNPNAMTLGTTLGGQELGATTYNMRLSHAALATYPAGSSFKVFTLAAALQTGVAGPSTRMSCNGTWVYNGFTFHNYEDHHLGTSVDLKAAMAFSCNTTYMPLSIRVYEKDPTALTDLVRDFGFGQLSGIRYLPEARGILPDAHYFEITKRWDGVYRPYNGFDQVQLAIGQGSYLGSPMQLANAYAAIGNGGTLWTPRIVAEVRHADGTVEEVPNEVQRQIPLTAEQLAYVVDTMQAVVDYSYGTAYSSFRGFGIPVAGKSGTAETGGPNPDAWFPAIAPADDPQISVATVLVRVPLATGGSDAAPLVRRVMAQYFSER